MMSSLSVTGLTSRSERRTCTRRSPASTQSGSTARDAATTAGLAVRCDWACTSITAPAAAASRVTASTATPRAPSLPSTGCPEIIAGTVLERPASAPIPNAV
eukprot:scaffold125944_cov27-Tisochrysis_lutea.AAC.2